MKKLQLDVSTLLVESFEVASSTVGRVRAHESDMYLTSLCGGREPIPPTHDACSDPIRSCGSDPCVCIPQDGP